MSKTVDGKTITYVNDITAAYTQVLQTYDENGAVLNTYDYGVNRIRSRGETDESYIYDGHGSVAGVVNPKNELISYRYTAYGDLAPNSPTPCVYGYNAEDTDYTTGLQYLRARYYDVNLGRFTQKDKARGETLTPQTLNRYLYVGNNPINRIDPSGYGWLSNAWNKTTAVVKKAATAVATTAKKVYNYAKTAITNASSSSSNSRGNTSYQSSSGGGGSGGGGGSWGTEAYSNKQGQAVKGNNSSAPSSKGFPPLAINPDGEILGFLGRVCDKTKEKWDNAKAWLGDPQNQKALFMGGAIAVGVILTVATAGALGPVAAMAIGGAVAAGGTTLVTDKFDDGQINIKENWKTYAVNMAGGAIVGAAAGIAGPAVLAGQMSLTAGTAAMTGIGFANSGLKQSVLNDGKIDYGQALKEGVTTGLLFGVFTGAAQLLSGGNALSRATASEEVINNKCQNTAKKTAGKILNAEREGSAAMKSDAFHRSASFASEEQLANGKVFNITGGDGKAYTLLQTAGEVNGKQGVFEYLLSSEGTVMHQKFKPNGIINGKIN